jgi:hypothetical protein
VDKGRDTGAFGRIVDAQERRTTSLFMSPDSARSWRYLSRKLAAQRLRCADGDRPPSTVTGGSVACRVRQAQPLLLGCLAYGQGIRRIRIRSITGRGLHIASGYYDPVDHSALRAPRICGILICSIAGKVLHVRYQPVPQRFSTTVVEGTRTEQRGDRGAAGHQRRHRKCPREQRARELGAQELTEAVVPTYQSGLPTTGSRSRSPDQQVT